MAKYLVIVNQKYLVSVEANTNGGAEHRVLDLFPYPSVIHSCQAFSQESMKTEFFSNSAINCETISYSELVSRADHCKQLRDEESILDNVISQGSAEIETLREKLVELENSISHSRILKDAVASSIQDIL